MGRPRKEQAGEAPRDDVPEGPAPAVRFLFRKPWSSPMGFFPAGSTAELPQEIAESLEAEGSGEVV